MAKIFISYSRQDTDQMRQVVNSLTETFLADGIFVDTHNTAGQGWWDNILKQLKTASVFVYLLSDNSLRSYACRAEYLEAMRLGKHIIPVDLTDNLDLTRTDPPLAFILSRVHRIPNDKDKLIRAITEGLMQSNINEHLKEAQTSNMRDVSGKNVYIGSTINYPINYVMQPDAPPIQQPDPGSANNTPPERRSSATPPWEPPSLHSTVHELTN